MPILSYAVAVGLSIFALFPLAWMTLSSLKSYEEIYHFPPTYWPTSFSLSFYEKVLTTTPFLSFLWNSIVVSGLSTVVSVAFAATLVASADLDGGSGGDFQPSRSSDA